MTSWGVASVHRSSHCPSGNLLSVFCVYTQYSAVLTLQGSVNTFQLSPHGLDWCEKYSKELLLREAS